MAANRFKTQLERDKHLLKVAELYLQQVPQFLIAEKCGCTKQQISYDIKSLHKQWVQDANSCFDERKAIELTRIDKLERTYWEAWERSVGQIVTKTRTVEGIAAAARQKATDRTETLNGDPRYLAGVERCIQMRREILGLDAPVKHKVETEDKTFDGDAGRSRLETILDAARARRTQQDRASSTSGQSDAERTPRSEEDP